MILAFAGGLGGLIAAATVAPMLALRFPLAGAASQLDVPLDLTVLGFTLAVSIVTVIGISFLARTTVTVTDFFALASRSARVMSRDAETLESSTFTMTSLGWSPAFAAGPSFSTSATRAPWVESRPSCSARSWVIGCRLTPR